MLLAQHIFAQFTLPTKQHHTPMPLQTYAYLFLNNYLSLTLFINHAIQIESKLSYFV